MFVLEGIRIHSLHLHELHDTFCMKLYSEKPATADPRGSVQFHPMDRGFNFDFSGAAGGRDKYAYFLVAARMEMINADNYCVIMIPLSQCLAYQ